MCLTYVQYYIYKRRGIEMFSLLLFLCVWVSVYFLCMCVLVGRVFVCMCMCLSHLSCLCFNVVGLFVLMHCSIFFFRLFCCCFHFHFVSACVGVFCFQFSLPITKYFVCFCFAYNWMFCLRSHIHSTKVIFFSVWVSFFHLWMVSFSMTTASSLLMFVCWVCWLLILSLRVS